MKLLKTALLALACSGSGLTAAADDATLPAPLERLLDEKRYAEALPQLQKLAAQQHQHAEFMLGNYYICGKIVAFSCTDAEAHFSRAIRRTGSSEALWLSALAKNEVAWINAACRQPGFRGNNEKALRLVRESSSFEDSPYTTDTFAAVLANRGEFGRAATLQLRAIRGLKALDDFNAADAHALEEFEKRLDLYRKRQAASFDAATAKANCNALPD